MKSEVTFTCLNIVCKDFDLVRTITKPDLFLKSCNSCHQTGKLKIIHGSREFNTAEALVEYFRGLSGELNPLIKLKEAGIADNTDLHRIREIHEILEDAVCPCCGQSSLKK